MRVLINKWVRINVKELFQLDEEILQIDVSPIPKEVKYGVQHDVSRNLFASDDTCPLFRPNSVFQAFEYILGWCFTDDVIILMPVPFHIKINHMFNWTKLKVVSAMQGRNINYHIHLESHSRITDTTFKKAPHVQIKIIFASLTFLIEESGLHKQASIRRLL